MALRRESKRGAKARGGAHFAGAAPAKGARRSAAATEGTGLARPAVGPDPLDNDTPRPIGVDPEATGSFERLNAGEGAILTTRDNVDDAVDAARNRLSGTTGMMRLDASVLPPVEDHTPETHANKRVVGVLVVLVLAVLLGGGYVFLRLTASPEVEEEQDQTEQMQVATTDAIEYRGTTYQLEQNEDGTWYLTRQSQDEGAEPQSLGDLAGTPVAAILYDGAILFPENESDGTWDIMVYTLGAGWGQLLDDEGNGYSEEGAITEATLDGTELEIVSDTGTTTIPLDW